MKKPFFHRMAQTVDKLKKFRVYLQSFSFKIELFELRLVDLRFGGRFPRARLKPPRRKLLRGLETRGCPAGVAAYTTINYLLNSMDMMAKNQHVERIQ